MDNPNLSKAKIIIAILLAVMLICTAATVGYMTFSLDESAATITETTGANATGYAETAATDSGGGNCKNNTTMQKSSTPTKGTALSGLHANYTTAATDTAQKHAKTRTAKATSKSNTYTGSVKTERQGRCEIEIVCQNAAEYAKNHSSVSFSDRVTSGVILHSTTAEFYYGDTVFDILRRVCSANKIALEFTKTPLYNSYYIEGIGGLYEFDCSSSSGWIYCVNGEKPNRSCSEYAVNDGDKIVFAYTCKNGADV